MKQQQIERIEQLANLGMSEQDEKLKEDLNKMIAYIDVIRMADTTGIEPMSHSHLLWGNNVFREDEPMLESDRISRETLLKNAPKTEQGYLVVPKTLAE